MLSGIIVLKYYVTVMQQDKKIAASLDREAALRSNKPMITQKPKLRQEIEAEKIASSYAKGFGNPINPRCIAEKKRYLWEWTYHWSAKKVKRGLSLINALVYAIAKDQGAVMEEDGKKSVRRSVMQRIVRSGCRVLKTSVSGLTTYIKRWWDDTSASAVRRLRDEFEDLGLFKVSGCQKGVYAWTTLLDIDMLGLLALQETLEQAWLDIHQKSYEDLPSHRGGFVRMCWNAVKHVLGRDFNRKAPEEKVAMPDPQNVESDRVGFGNGNRKSFVAVYYENGVELDMDRLDRDGIHYPLEEVQPTSNKETRNRQTPYGQFT